MSSLLRFSRNRATGWPKLFALAVLMACGTTLLAADSPKEPDPAELIRFDVSLDPSDPFDPSNQANRNWLEPLKVRPGEVVRLTITATPEPGYHTYPVTQRSSAPEMTDAFLTKIKFQDAPGLKPLWPISESEPEFVDEGIGVFLEHKKPFTVSQDLFLLPGTAPGLKTLHFSIELQVCKRTCLNGTHNLSMPFEVAAGPEVAIAPELRKRLDAAPPPIKVRTVPAGLLPPNTPPDSAGNTRGSSLLGFILSGFFWGAVSLFTPCVFPMIPITVSFFLKQSEKTHHRPVSMALVYSLTIVAVLTVGAMVLLGVFQAASTYWATNLALGGVFVFFALSLFGMYDIALPSGLARFTSAHEGRGGTIGVIFMALTFSIISFSCVAPFLGGFAALVPSLGDVWGMLRSGELAKLGWLLLQLFLGALAFSVTFAAPFFLLALFPKLLHALPRSGAWMNTVKVVMGFLELAAALKFLRAAELGLFAGDPGYSGFLTYDLVLGIYVALSLLCGVYLLNIFRLAHDGPAEHLGVPRLIFSLLFLSLGFYLMPGLFKLENGQEQRPTGSVYAWLNSFLLPDEPGDSKSVGISSPGTPAGTTSKSSSKLLWLGNLEQGLKEAHDSGRLVFIDFTGEICSNCKYNEYSVFPRPMIKELLNQYVLVQLYLDTVPAKYQPTTSADENYQLQWGKFKTRERPLYAIVKPDGQGDFRIISVYKEGKINNVSGFAAFLKQPLTVAGAERTPVAKKE